MVAVRLLFVPPRFADATVGGAERLVHALATRAIPDGWSAEVATTCARSHYTWENELPPGESTEDGVLVRRFEVGPRDAPGTTRLHPRILSARPRMPRSSSGSEAASWSPGLEAFLEEHAPDYDLCLLAPYMFGTTLWGAQIAPERSALIPCFHDEPYARLRTVRRRRRVRPRLRLQLRGRGAARCGASTEPGTEASSAWASTSPTGRLSAGFAESRRLGPYLLYAGRIEEGKRVHVAVEYAARYAAERPMRRGWC